jgi:hypothetical protein
MNVILLLELLELLSKDIRRDDKEDRYRMEVA